MRQRVALVGSIAIHAACGLALVVRSSSPPSIEPAHAEVIEQPLQLIDIVSVPDSGGGGAPGRGEALRERVASRSPSRRASPIVRSVDRATRSLSDSLGDIASASLDGGGGGDGGGRGGGHGRGIGRGVGEGLGDRASAGDRVPSVPAAPPASKARPPKLVYPTRERDASEGELYLARVTIDTDGYVVGARLLHSAGPKDNDASTMIFKFRYAPALDDDGHPIKATIEQPFLVQ